MHARSSFALQRQRLAQSRQYPHSLSLGKVGDLLTERGVNDSYEAI